MSACLHALLLDVPVTVLRSTGARGHGASSSMQLRLALPTAMPRAGIESPQPTTTAAMETSRPAPPPPAPDPRPEPAPSQESVPEPAEVPDGGPPPAEASAAVPVPQIVDTEYLPSRLLDVYPKPMSDVPMVYPDAAATQDMSGRVKLLLLIDEIGSVVEASVVEADPPGYFEQSAIDTFRGVLFSPGMRDGHPVKSRLVVEVSYEARTQSARGTR